MGCCALCPGRKRHFEYVFYHRGTDECVIGSNDMQVHKRIKARDLTDTNQTVILIDAKRRSDSGFYSERVSCGPNDITRKTNSGVYSGDHVVDQLENNFPNKNCNCKTNRRSPDDEKRIQRHYRFMLENLMAGCVTPRLVQDGILSLEDEADIRKGLTERAKAELLIQKLVQFKPNSFATFLYALRETGQEFIAHELEKDE